jgi:hypothetical protein
MNSRFIQGVFDDRQDPGRFARFGVATWDPEANTSNLIAALPEWYRYGLRAFTVGFQGGGPCFTTDIRTIDNNPFGEDGTRLDPACAARMDRLIRAADEVGMVVIVSFLYHAQAARIRDDAGIRSAVSVASRFLRDAGYTNVIIEVANENDALLFNTHPVVQTEEGMVSLIELARRESGGIPVGCSALGGKAYRKIAEVSDVVFVHGNETSRQAFYNVLMRLKEWAPGKPVVCNEDSAAPGQMRVALDAHASWGYYNNMTKQEPPADWGILAGEDRFFALRMAEGIGIDTPSLPFEERYYLQGFEPEMVHGDHVRWPRVASLYPESIDRVEFYCDGDLRYTCYDEPFSMNWRSNWQQGGTRVVPGSEWKALIRLRSGEVVEKMALG